LTRVPVALVDNEGEAGAQAKALPAIWKNQWMWMGFAISLVWVLMKAYALFFTGAGLIGIQAILLFLLLASQRRQRAV